MIIIGAKGFASEVLDIFYQKNNLENLVFYDDLNKDIGDLLYDKFPVLKSQEEVNNFFRDYGQEFVIGIGNPILRKKMENKFISWGGELKSVISPLANIGKHDVSIGEGTVILSGVNISNSVNIGKGCLIYYNSIITHDCKIGDFVEISPSVNVLGRARIGSYTHLGSNSTILPNIQIGENVTIGAGAVVTKNIPNNSVAIGVPAVIVKQ